MTITCSTCRHWHKLPLTANTLSQTPQGHCRWGPPHATALPVNGPGGQGMAVSCNYPTLPGNFPACGQHAVALTLAGGIS